MKIEEDAALLTALVMASHLDRADADALVDAEKARMTSPWGWRGLASGVRYIRRGYEPALGGYAAIYAAGAEAALIEGLAAVSLPEAEGRAAEVLHWVLNGLSHAEIIQRLRRGDDDDEHVGGSVIAFPRGRT